MYNVQTCCNTIQKTVKSTKASNKDYQPSDHLPSAPFPVASSWYIPGLTSGAAGTGFRFWSLCLVYTARHFCSRIVTDPTPSAYIPENNAQFYPCIAFTMYVCTRSCLSRDLWTGTKLVFLRELSLKSQASICRSVYLSTFRRERQREICHGFTPTQTVPV